MARREYQALKNISEGKPANFGDLTKSVYVTKPPMTTEINQVPEDYKPQLTEIGQRALRWYEEQFRQDKQ